MRKIFVLAFVLISKVVFAQSEIENIRVPLLNYVEGTENGDITKLKKAFHLSFNMYYVANDSLKTWVGNEYIAGFKEGVKINRIGRIVLYRL
jgi:Putative lumazine-binding